MQQIRIVSILYTLCTDIITPQAARQETSDLFIFTRLFTFKRTEMRLASQLITVFGTVTES